jgi:hypothetical protein
MPDAPFQKISSPGNKSNPKPWRNRNWWASGPSLGFGIILFVIFGQFLTKRRNPISLKYFLKPVDIDL